MNAQMDGPPDDPQDHYCKRVCGRLAGGLIRDTKTSDIEEVVRWLNDELYYRQTTIPEASPF